VRLAIPYGAGTVEVEVEGGRFLGTLETRMERGILSLERQREAVREALDYPVGSSRLAELAAAARRVTLIASDHTRPVPSRLILPLMLEEIRRGNPGAEVTILVATGCHRASTRQELEAALGPEVARRERVVVHDCDAADAVSLGRLPSGGELALNRLAVETDLLAAEGFIEPHLFAGFSGGRKSVLPGVAARRTVLYNHNAEFLAHPRARAGVLDGNPVHTDMIHAARAAGLAFICNVVLNRDKSIVYAAAGDCDRAHRQGCAFLAERCGVACPAGRAPDIVIAGNGGRPLDQNISQAVKGMAAAAALVRPGGVIIMLAEAAGGAGGEEFHRIFAGGEDLDAILASFMRTPKEATRIDQWQSQVFIGVLKKARVIFVSKAPDALVRDFRMIPARTAFEALALAEDLLQKVQQKQPTIAAIPDGVSVIVEPGD